MQESKRNHAIDTLRVIAVIMVIGIHSSGQYVLDNPNFDTKYYVAAGIEAIVQIGVPLFVLISGAFILGKIDSWQAHYCKRLPRLVLPLLFWLPAYWLWMWIKGDDLTSYLNGFWQGRSFMHLWYLVMLIGLYIVAPLLNEMICRIKKRYEKNAYRVLALLSLMFLLVGALARFYDEYFQYQRFFPYVFLDFIGYFIAGYTIMYRPTRRLRIWGSLYILASIATFIMAYLAKKELNSYYFYNNLAPGIILSSISLFAIFSSERFKKLDSNFLSRMQADVMGIYLIHIAVLNIVDKIISSFASGIMELAWISILIRVPLIFFASLLLVRLLKKVPYTKWIL